MTAPVADEATVVDVPMGEALSIPERLIVAPTRGTFHRLDGKGDINGGDMVNPGDVIGLVRSRGASTPIRSPFVGLLVEILAFEGERVRPGQPVAWVSVA